ncbi:tripartite ATP-independent transporter DctM subunit [Breoghania corrubedonensis]|uniref:Tripartite ATP-independent transporter DctM subunit n=1 Tax=Breoghania corrubedonensis TaxID=665038 RepID=A0A2T5VC97_9HYPH|nr:TRAP transporter large permease subunit [Breoghania corrubedonensis]PTW61372.1 tripartite ATP-independent transporter DctM subunit [Breoghania corrubedonensis]
MGEVLVDRPAVGLGVRSPWLDRVDRLLGYVIEIPAVILVIVEVVVLFAGVTARYVLERPFVWSDELASLCFLWLGLLGTCIALRNGAHMRMTAIVGMLSPRKQAFAEVIAVVTAAAFVALILEPSYSFALHEVIVTSPGLGISAAWRAAALPVASTLMILISLVRMLKVGSPLMVLGAVVSLFVIGGILVLLQPVFATLGNVNLVIFFVIFLTGAIFAGVPIAFAFGLATFAYLSLTTHIPLSIIVGRMDGGMSSLILLAVPLFVLLGYLIEMTGMARAMVGFLANLVGHIRGGLNYVLLGAIFLVSGISGAKAADMAAVAPVLFPEMKRRGSKPGELVAILSASGAMSETIPPSLVLITIGSVTGVSISALFTGGLVPAVVLAIALGIVAWWRTRGEDMSRIKRATARQIGRSFVIALPALVLPFVIRAAVVEGVATATEVSTIGIVYAVVAGLLVYREFDWRRLYPILVGTASLSGAILFIIGAATAMGWALTQSGFSAELATFMSTLPGGSVSFMAVSIVVFIILGSVLEGIPAIVLFGPLLFPISEMVGINGVHYAIVVILSMGIGLFAPPFGVGYYTACVIGQVNPDEGMRPIVGYLVALFLGVVLIAAVPWFSIGFL